jgi:hypothetical protein
MSGFWQNADRRGVVRRRAVVTSDQRSGRLDNSRAVRESDNVSPSSSGIVSRLLVAAFLGALYAWMSINFWGGYAAAHPINDWLLHALAKPAQEASYFAAIYTHDVIVNVLLAAPVAAVLVTFRSLNNWPSVLTAVAFGVAVAFWDTNWDSASGLLSSYGFWLGLGMFLWSMPIAFVGIRVLKRRHESAA